MRYGARCIVPLSALLLLASCHRSVPYANVAADEQGEPPFPQGVFYFQAAGLHQSGRIILADTLVIVESRDRECEEASTALLRTRSFSGAGVTDRRDARLFFCADPHSPADYVATHAGTSFVVVVNLRTPVRASRWAHLVQEVRAQRGIGLARTPSIVRWEWRPLRVQRTPFAVADTGATPRSW